MDYKYDIVQFEDGYFGVIRYETFFWFLKCNIDFYGCNEKDSIFWSSPQFVKKYCKVKTLKEAQDKLEELRVLNYKIYNENKIT